LVVSVPHAGTFLPDDLAAGLNPLGRAVADTDWFVDRLYDFAPALGATLLVATHSRTVADLNRSPDGGALYPGQAETGFCPTESFDGAPLYDGPPPDAAQRATRRARVWQPYHDALSGQLARVRALHGRVVLLDAHSIRGAIPRLFPGRLPDLNYGTNGGVSCTPGLAARAMAATAGSGFSQVLDGRFRGGHITRHYGDPARGVQAIQLELAQSTYMDEDAAPRWDPARAAPLVAALRSLVRELLDA
jgi:N-formylglutamate deformylase